MGTGYLSLPIWHVTLHDKDLWGWFGGSHTGPKEVWELDTRTFYQKMPQKWDVRCQSRRVTWRWCCLAATVSAISPGLAEAMGISRICRIYGLSGYHFCLMSHVSTCLISVALFDFCRCFYIQRMEEDGASWSHDLSSILQTHREIGHLCSNEDLLAKKLWPCRHYGTHGLSKVLAGSATTARLDVPFPQALAVLSRTSWVDTDKDRQGIIR